MTMQETKTFPDDGSLMEQRHQMEAPETERRFARLAIDHPDAIRASLRKKEQR